LLNIDNEIGREMYSWAEDLFPICRSLTGPGVRETLNYLKKLIPELKIESVPSGYKAFDWTVPKEWSVLAAYIEDDKGNVVVDFKDNNLHLVGYSHSIDKWVELDELDDHLFSLPEQPTAIPYVTSYYDLNWGFCITDILRKQLKEGKYHVVIDSKLEDGVLNYGELIIPGETDREILLSTYICHPSMANNELSGPVVTTALAKWLMGQMNRKYTYRILFVPETIGSIVYLSKHLEHLKEKVDAGLVVTCVGDDRDYSFLPSRLGSTLIDRVSLSVMSSFIGEFKKYSFLDRGSDERQFCSPGVDLPVASIMRTKYGIYPEYHTSLDDLSLISPAGLSGGYSLIKKVIQCLELNNTYISKVFCEPQLGKRNLYPRLSTKSKADYVEAEIILNVLAYCDGQTDLLSISEILKKPIFELKDVVNILIDNALIEEI